MKQAQTNSAEKFGVLGCVRTKEFGFQHLRLFLGGISYFQSYTMQKDLKSLKTLPNVDYYA